MLDYLSGNLLSWEWWLDEIASYVVFGIAAGLCAGWFAERLRRRRERREREPYEGWTLQVIGYDDEPESLYWEDVKRYLLSEFELWKWIKSMCSGAGRVTARSARMAQNQGWLRIEGPPIKRADSDDVGRAFRDDVGHRFRSKSAGRSD